MTPPKAWTMLVISSQSVSGSLKILMVYVGMTCATALMRISLPTYESIFSFHLDNLSSSLSFSAQKVFFFDLSTKEGRPRYVSCCYINIALIRSFISSWRSCGVFQLKNKEVFSQSIFGLMLAHKFPRFAQVDCNPPRWLDKKLYYYLQKRGERFMGLMDKQRPP